MTRKIKPALIIIAAAVFTAAAIIYYFYLERQERERALERISSTISSGLVVVLDSETVIADGARLKSSAAPFMERGIMYASATQVAEYLGASMEKDAVTGIITMKRSGFQSFFTMDINVIVLNDEPIVMRSKPIERGGGIFLPADIIATALNVTCFRSYEYGIAVYNASKPLSAADFKIMAEDIGLEPKIDNKNIELDSLGVTDREVYASARAGDLYVSGSGGVLYKWLLLDDFSLSKERQVLSQAFPPDTPFILVNNADAQYLCNAKTNELYCPSPAEITGGDLKYLMWQLILAKHEGSEAAAGAAALKEIISGAFDSEIFLNIKSHELQNGNYESIVHSRGSHEIDSAFASSWRDMISKARKGDVLLFRNKESNDKYGYFNHAALIVDVDRDIDTVQLLEARSSELGVGYDSPSDFVTAASFSDDEYWKDYDIVVLCRVSGADAVDRDKLAVDACEHFNGYTFGFGGYWGAKQTTCVELINTALRLSGVELISDREYTQKIKDVLSGESSSIILLPDDVLVSDNVQVIAHFDR